jgi:hypothetical protein
VAGRPTARTRLSPLRPAPRSEPPRRQPRHPSRVPKPQPTRVRHSPEVQSRRQALLRGPVESGQYTSGDYTQVLDDYEVLGSIGTVGDALDNALAESYVDSYKTELIADRVWRSQAQVELATVTWVAWFNHQRLHSSLGDIPPVEFEQNHARVALNASIPFNGSVAGIPSNAADGLTTRRAWTLGVDFAGDRPISPRTVALLAAGPAQAAPQAGQG